jgi:uncharacterized protein
MTLIVDASGLFAQADAEEPRHGAVKNVLESERGALITSQFAAAEADYLVLKRLGVDVELSFLDDLADATYSAECLTSDELATARDVANHYRDLKVGLADASLVVLAQRFKTRRVLTLDESCFRAMTPLQGGSFTLLPADG